ncbi:MAG: hypothetical protein R6X25_13610 [Candidatus Krumholzibacteriia bacterium]
MNMFDGYPRASSRSNRIASLSAPARAYPGHASARFATVLALTLLVAALGADVWHVAGAAQDPRRTAPAPEARSSLPYVACNGSPSFLPRIRSVRGHPYALVDTEGDGYPELMRNDGIGVTLTRYRGGVLGIAARSNLPPGYLDDGDGYAELGSCDADGDGRDETVVIGPASDGSHWRLWVLDVEGQRVLGDLRLPIDRERRPDGRWDGSYSLVGSMRLPGRDRPVLVLICTVGHDVHGRGVLAVDPAAGEVVWRRRMDAHLLPVYSQLADVDGDGWREIVLGSSAVDNLHGEQLHGASDDSGLNRFGKRIIGVHLHDVKGVTDHQIPGTGDVDYALIAPYIPSTAHLTLEVNPKLSVNELTKSLVHLEKYGIIAKL